MQYCNHHRSNSYLRLASFGFAAVAFSYAVAPVLAQAREVEGSHDHPLLSRYPGSVIIRYDESEFDELLVPVGPATDIDQFEATERAEGKTTRITYEMDTSHSTLEVLQSYRDALAKAGLEIVYSCAVEACGNHLYFQNLERPFIIHKDHRYLAAKGTLPQGTAWVSVRVYRTARGDPPVRAMVNIAELGRLEEDLIIADAAAMARDLEQHGHVALYGIYFDTDKAEIQPQSDESLREMASLLQDNPRLEVFIVGHTDGMGTVAHNMDLSQRRAEAVVAALVARGVERPRLEARGVGPFAPVASNHNEDGRTLNRRVELVER